MERVKEGGGGGEGRKETLADKPWILKTAHLAFHARVRTLRFRAVIGCRKINQ